MQASRTAALFGACLLVAACGGGGGGDRASAGPAPAPGPGPAPAAITFGAPTVLATAAAALSTPAAAIDSGGVAAVLWAQSGLVPAPGQAPLVAPYVVARENVAASGWSALTQIESAGAGDAASDRLLNLQAAASGVGITSAWLRAPIAGVADRVRSARRQAPSGWDLSTIGAATPPALRSDLVFTGNDAGLQAMAWTELVPGGPQLQLRVRRVGAGGFDWVAPALPVQVNPAAPAGQPALAIDSAGRLLIAWRQGDLTGDVRTRTFDIPTQTYTTELVVDTNQPDMRAPRVAALGVNDFLITWEQSASGVYDLRSKRGTAAGWPQNPLLVDARSESVSDARLLAGPNGTAFVAWQQADTLFASRFSSANGQWTVPVAVGAGLSGVARDLRAGLDGNGNAVLAWTQRGGSGVADLYFATLAAGATAASAATLLESEAGTVEAPTLAVNAAGNAVVAWRQAVSGQTQPNLVARIAR